MKALTFVTLMSVASSTAVAADAGCKMNPALTGRCYVVRGNISVVTEAGPVFDIQDAKRRLIIRAAPNSTKLLPENVGRYLFSSEISAAEVRGTYEVCPLPSEPPLQGERFVCVNSGSNLLAIRPSGRAKNSK
jgi:hypothetical protein